MAEARNVRIRRVERKARRREFAYPATIHIQGAAPLPCLISDISDTGAKLTLDADSDLPDSFMLLFSANGAIRRRCRRAWKNGLDVGVQFLRGAMPHPPAT